jgi:hypothetical protein
METNGVIIAAVSNTVILGIVIPSTNPAFLGVVGVHILLGLGCVLSGLASMLASKGRGRHSALGTIYYWFMCSAFVTTSTLSFLRWAEDYVLFLLVVFWRSHWSTSAGSRSPWGSVCAFTRHQWPRHMSCY